MIEIIRKNDKVKFDDLPMRTFFKRDNGYIGIKVVHAGVVGVENPNYIKYNSIHLDDSCSPEMFVPSDELVALSIEKVVITENKFN
ncbi:hypothetical protein SAMN02746066_04654 [Anaerosporobacter mobilis DSM 15930]|jgi:hypothetical protein|uniref:Uncharacterized protein n=1 Tax=Anaerosporobacter mobilis DSM 15930 TaxID=1120996 RepID=A0A1M7NPW7_9FIRM|nr:hypothetical protein [Anaerosporobacter mobilis]SHN05903.1 hypothetical protein SAMN02746066_04654 [Anaerosporobacter mobilis DSM 15930]